jgi:hypothetical protein
MVIHDRFGTNLIGGFTFGKGEVDSALARSPHRLQRRFYHHLSLPKTLSKLTRGLRRNQNIIAA